MNSFQTVMEVNNATTANAGLAKPTSRIPKRIERAAVGKRIVCTDYTLRGTRRRLTVPLASTYACEFHGEDALYFISMADATTGTRMARFHSRLGAARVRLSFHRTANRTHVSGRAPQLSLDGITAWPSSPERRGSAKVARVLSGTPVGSGREGAFP